MWDLRNKVVVITGATNGILGGNGILEGEKAKNEGWAWGPQAPWIFPVAGAI